METDTRRRTRTDASTNHGYSLDGRQAKRHGCNTVSERSYNTTYYYYVLAFHDDVALCTGRPPVYNFDYRHVFCPPPLSVHLQTATHSPIDSLSLGFRTPGGTLQPFPYASTHRQGNGAVLTFGHTRQCEVLYRTLLQQQESVGFPCDEREP